MEEGTEIRTHPEFVFNTVSEVKKKTKSCLCLSDLTSDMLQHKKIAAVCGVLVSPCAKMGFMSGFMRELNKEVQKQL